MYFSNTTGQVLLYLKQTPLTDYKPAPSDMRPAVSLAENIPWCR